MKLLILALAFVAIVKGHVANYGEDSSSTIPTLYTKFNAIVVELDQDSFDDTVHCNPLYSSCTAFVVQFYNHRLALSTSLFVPYMNASLKAYNWQSIVKMGVVNCGDEYNKDVCDRHSFEDEPMIKYFAKSSTQVNFGSPIEVTFNTTKLLSAIVHEVRQDYHNNKYSSWPNLEPIPDVRHFLNREYPGRTELMIVHVDSMDEPFFLNMAIVLQITAGKEPFRFAFKGHLLDRLRQHRTYPNFSVLKYVYAGQHNCNDPERKKKESVYKNVFERLGLEFERGDYATVVGQGGNEMITCQNHTSTYHDENSYEDDFYGYRTKRSVRSRRSADALLEAKDMYEMNEFCNIPDFAGKDVPKMPEAEAMFNKHPLHYQANH